MNESMWKRPLFYTFLSSSVGIIYGYLFIHSGMFFSIILITFLMAMLIFLYMKARIILILVMIFSMIIFMYIAYPHFHEIEFMKKLDGRKVGISGRIISIKGGRFLLDKVKIHPIGDETGKWVVLKNKIYFNLNGRYLGERYLRIGSWVFSEGELRVISYYPFLIFDSDFHSTSFVPYMDSITTYITYHTGRLRKGFEEYLRGFHAGKTIVNILFGGSIPYSEKRMLIESGVYHFFVVSGLHVGIFSTMIITLFLFLRKNTKFSIVLSIISVFLYSAMVGFSIPAFRASIMIIIFLLFRLLEYHQNSFNILGLSGLILILLDPLSVLSQSFHLSFVATASYILVGSLSFSSYSVHTNKGYILSMLFSSFTAMLFISPLLILYFGIFPLFSIPLTLLLSPVVFPYILFLSFLSFIFFILKLEFISSIFIYAMEPILDFFDLILKIIMRIPFHMIKIESIQLRIILFFSIIAISIMFFLYREKTYMKRGNLNVR